MGETMPAGALWEDRLLRRLAKLVTELDLDPSDFVIFGSGPMLAHGLRQHVRDLDVVARGKAWHRISERGIPDVGAISGAPIALFWGGLIQFSAEWISQEWDTDDLINRAEPIQIIGTELIQELPFAQLTDVLAYKQRLDRPKDRPDIDVLLDVLRQPSQTRELTSPNAAWQPAGRRRTRLSVRYGTQSPAQSADARICR
jgi:hypothetical protein